ncbi:MAG TPA: DNA-directed RNA polymerase subunit P [archaeon]|nr:DNA-directed RNA polymerase subunit P [archaeon]
MMYKCLNCGKTIEMSDLKDKIRCVYCGYRILSKSQPKTTVTIKAR